MVSSLLDIGIITIFAREVLEGAIIIGEYRTIVSRSDNCSHSSEARDGRHTSSHLLEPGVTKERALREVTMSAMFATAMALIAIACIAIPLGILSHSFDTTVSNIIEGVSKIVASLCLLGLSLKLPTFFGLYGGTKINRQETTSCCWVNRATTTRESGGNVNTAKQQETIRLPTQCSGSDHSANARKSSCADTPSSSTSSSPISSPSRAPPLRSDHQERDSAHNGPDDLVQEPILDDSRDDEDTEKLTISSIRFNVVWNIWREVAECGMFLIPFFLSGEHVEAIPLSAAVGGVVGGLCGFGIYFANLRLKSRLGLCIFSVSLLVVLSAGLFSGGCYKLEMELGMTPVVWRLSNKVSAISRPLPCFLSPPSPRAQPRLASVEQDLER
jgi:hypothetical protein